jgi:hypothetical protein
VEQVNVSGNGKNVNIFLEGGFAKGELGVLNQATDGWQAIGGFFPVTESITYTKPGL